MDSIPQKQCTKCGEWKPATTEYYAPMKFGKYGVRADCRECRRKYDFDRYHNNPEVRARHSETAHEWKLNNREHLNQYSREYYQENKEYIRAKEKRLQPARSKRYREKHPEKVRAGHYKWRQEHPEQWAIILKNCHRKRRATTRNIEGSYTHGDVIAQLKAQDGKCWWCSKLVGDEYHPDHLIALSRGGSNKANNIVIACVSCNLKKYNKMPWEWIGRLI